MGTSAGVSEHEAVAPTECATTCSHGGASGNDIVHEIQRQELYGTNDTNDGVLFHRQAGKPTHTTPGGRFHGVGATDGTFDAGTKNHFGDGAGECKICAEVPVACGNR